MTMPLTGFLRTDGSYGLRNHVLVLSTSDLSNSTARKVADLIRETVPICPGFGRCAIGEDLEQHFRTLTGLIANPNVYGAVIVSMEPMSAAKLAERVRPYGKPVRCFDYDTDGGPLKVTEAAARAASAAASTGASAPRRGRSSSSP